MKKLIRALAAGVGVTGALAAANRRLRRVPPPPIALAGTRRPWTWRGHEIVAIEAGEGPLALLVHGLAPGASMVEFRRLFPLLAQRHRVVAFDLLGCGLSAKPNIAYSAELFTEQIVDALGEFGTEPVTLIGSSLGAAFCIRAAARANDRVAQLVVATPTGLGGKLDGAPTPSRRALGLFMRTPIAGEAFFNALASRRSLRWALAHRAYADAASVTPAIVEQYYATTHQPGARFVPAALIGGALDCNVARDLPFVEAPTLVLWGERAPSFASPANAHEFLTLAQHGRLVTFPASGLLPHEEEPDAVADAIDQFVLPLVHGSDVGSSAAGG